MARDLDWLIDQLSRKLNFNVNQTDQDFSGPASDTNKLLKAYLNEAYSLEVTSAKVEVGLRPFMTTTTFTWDASDQIKELPTILQDCQIYSLSDETDQTPGQLLWVGDDGGMTTILSWRDRTNLMWGTTGPSSDRTILATYLSNANELTNGTDEPVLIPYEHRPLLVWSAAILARSEADERVPEAWVDKHLEARSLFHSLLARGTYPLGYSIKEPGKGNDWLR